MNKDEGLQFSREMYQAMDVAGTREVPHGKIKTILYPLPLTVNSGFGEGGRKLEVLGSGQLEGFGDPVRLWAFSLLFFGSAVTISASLGSGG